MGSRMKTVEIKQRIAAPSEDVWRILTDATILSGGEFGITRLDGEICDGGRIVLQNSTSGARKFRLQVFVPEQQSHMIWRGGMPFGLFTGTRHFRLINAGQSTEFTMREEFTGPMVPLIWKSMPDLTPSFQQFATALAHYAEKGKT